MIDSNATTLIEAFPLPVLVIGQDDLVVAANEQMTALLGDFITGRHFVSVLRQPAILRDIELVRQAGGGGRSEFITHGTNVETRFDVHIAPIWGDKLMLSFESRADQDGVGQMRRDFVANVSHELRTPLTALMGFIETIQGPAKDDPAARARFLDIMAREAERMTRLVDDLLSLSRVEATARVRMTDVIRVDDVLRRTLAELAPVIDARATKVDLSVTATKPEILGDEGQLRQVISNLVENAVKYGPHGGLLEISLTEIDHVPAFAGPGLELSVKDHGPGVAEHHLARLTERFYRVDDHRSREVGGTGLGLAIAKHIVNRHGGRLRIKSVVGQGTEAIVRLPLIQE